MPRHYDSFDAGPEWGTPEYIWQPLADSLDGFDLDPASGAESRPIADCIVRLPTETHGLGEVDWIGETQCIYEDGREIQWNGDVWVNPPYGRSHNSTWAEKFAEEAERDSVDSITALLPASTSTNWWHNNYAKHGDYFTFLDSRVSFDGSADKNASFASVIVTTGEVTSTYVETLNDLGQVLTQ